MICRAGWLALSLFCSGTIVQAGAIAVTPGGIISLNFSENSGNQAFAGGELIGPLMTDSSFWNNSNGLNPLASNSMANLIDHTGANTGASVTWASSNVWFNADGTGNDEARMAVGYLDDGATSNGFGVQISFSDIPYTRYRVYGLLASDQDGAVNYTTLDFTVNGVDVFGALSAAPAYNTTNSSLAGTGLRWSLADGVTRGNFWSIDTTGSTLTITAPPRGATERASISGVIVQNLIPEPGSVVLLGLGAVLLVAARRRALGC